MGRQVNIFWVARPRGGKWADHVKIMSESDPDKYWSISKYLVNIK